MENEAMKRGLETLAVILDELGIERQRYKELYSYIAGKIAKLDEVKQGDSPLKIFDAVLRYLEQETKDLRYLCDKYAPLAGNWSKLPRDKQREAKSYEDALRDRGISDSMAKNQEEVRKTGGEFRDAVGENVARFTADAYMKYLQIIENGLDSGNVVVDPHIPDIGMYCNAFRAKLEALPFQVDDTMMDALVGAYEDLVMKNADKR